MSESTGLFFDIFGIPVEFELDVVSLDKKYHTLASQYHPDRFVDKNTFEQKQAMMMASTINEAYRTLKDPLNRASYLLQQQGIDAEAPEHTQFEPEFLMQQMEWREALANAHMGEDSKALSELQEIIISEQETLYHALAQSFEQDNWEEAGLLVRKGRFLSKLGQEIQSILSMVRE